MTRKAVAGVILLLAGIVYADSAEIWTRWQRRSVALWSGNRPGREDCDSGLVPVLLPGTQQPLPAVLIYDGVCNGKNPPADEVIRTAIWLNERNVHAFVLCMKQSAGPDVALTDMQRAVRILRSRSAEWQIDIEAIGILGMGLNLGMAAKAALESGLMVYEATDKADRECARPDFIILLNPEGLDELPQGREEDLPFLFVASAEDAPGAISTERFCKAYAQGQRESPVMHFGTGEDWKEPLAVWLERFRPEMFDF